jgi:broad specificity phosphatase PhoE
LTRAGWKQAEALSVALAGHAPAVLVSSPYVRCLETLEPLAALRGLPVQQHAALAEAAPAADALALLATTATLGLVVACTHGDVQAALVESLSARGAAFARPLEFAKGSVWELSVNGGEVVGGR